MAEVMEAAGHFFPQRVVPAYINIAPPVQNTWYPLLAPTEDVFMDWVVTFQDTTDDVAKDVNVRMTIDGRVITRAVDHTHADNTYYYWSWQGAFATGVEALEAIAARSMFGGLGDADIGEGIPGHNIGLEVRMTSLPGANQILRALAFYDVERLT